MKAMILAAGLGTRLKPWTLEHPKAHVPVDGVPMLERVILKLKSQGFDEIVVNVHHFADQIIDFLAAHDFGVTVNVSDESPCLLDTGGGILHAGEYLAGEPFLVHNVDILSDADLAGLMHSHLSQGDDVTLLTSGRESSRKLLFNDDGELRGWHNLSSGEYRPAGCENGVDLKEEAFSGIYVMSPSGLVALRSYSETTGRNVFPIMDFLLTLPDKIKIRRNYSADLKLIDIGKPDTLRQASGLSFY